MEYIVLARLLTPHLANIWAEASLPEMFMNWIALFLFTLFASTIISGALLFLRTKDRRRYSGLILIILGLSAATFLIIMSSRYWFGDTTFFNAFINIQIVELIQTTSIVVVSIATAIAITLWLGRQYMRFMRIGRWHFGLALVIGILLLSDIAGTTILILMSKPEEVAEAHQVEARLQVNEQFSSNLYYSGQIKSPTSLAVGPDGHLYVSDLLGRIWLITEDNGQTNARIYAQGYDQPIGIAWHGHDLYIASLGTISVTRDTDGDGQADERRDIVTNLPVHLYPLHQNNGIAFGPDGRIYFGLGASSNTSVESQPLNAAILSVNPDGSDLKIFAKGIRNAYDLAFNANGDLFATDNAPAGLPITPGDELNYIQAGHNYGFPQYYEQPPAGSSSDGPVVIFRPHSSADGICFYDGNTFPEEYRNNAFVAMWMHGEIYRVELQKMPDGKYMSRASIFASGFINPLDVVVGKDGTLYVADFGTNGIYRIAYEKDTTRSPEISPIQN